jgi:hypothetical protein
VRTKDYYSILDLKNQEVRGYAQKSKQKAAVKPPLLS